jgi:hypothetical protein
METGSKPGGLEDTKDDREEQEDEPWRRPNEADGKSGRKAVGGVDVLRAKRIRDGGVL